MSRPALAIEYPLTRELEQAWVEAARATPMHHGDERDALHRFVESTLAPHGLEVVTVEDGRGDVLVALLESPKGRVLRVEPVVERTGDGDLVTLPDGTRLEELGWDVPGDAWNRPAADHDAVAGDALPRPAAALVTAWWGERVDAGTIPRRRAVDQPSSPSTGRGRVLYDAILTGDALRYADALEREARDVRAEVGRARARDDGRDAEYADALERLAVVERAEGKYDADTTDHVVTRAAETIRTGRARVTAAAEVGLEGEGWALTTKPAGEE